LEEALERYDYEKAALIQKAWRRWKGKKKALEQRAIAANLFKGKKERRRESVNKKFDGDYIRYDNNFGVQQAIVRYSSCSLLSRRQPQPFLKVMKKLLSDSPTKPFGASNFEFEDYPRTDFKTRKPVFFATLLPSAHPPDRLCSCASVKQRTSVLFSLISASSSTAVRAPSVVISSSLLRPSTWLCA
jgi:hypothetical protein